MPTLADSLVSSASRPLPLKMRPDLSVRYHRYQGRPYWVVKEPVGLKYYRFQEEEFSILRMLDGQTSYQEIKERFEKEFTPQRITLQDLQHFVGMLHRSGLVTADAPGQGRQLKRRRDENARRELLAKLSNVLAIRFKGIDPERLLNWLYPWTRWFFSRTFFCMAVVMALSALALVTVQHEVFRARLPAFHEFFGPANWFWLGITLAVTKVLHEFGHGLSCKHFGGECHEMGVMFLVLTPCLYCNVSDSWLLPNKWHRAAIGAAGMYVEMVLASIATFIWWFSEPGLLNHICLSIMFVCSVSTLLFNGNPLLRFDGYYILADIAEIPNLRQKSSRIVQRLASQYLLGIEQQEDPFLPQRHLWFFALYTTAATLYRWVVVISILMFLNKVLEPYGLKILGQAIGAMGLFGLIVQPMWQLVKFFRQPGRMHQVKRTNVLASTTVAGVLLALFLFLPLPFSVKGAVQIQTSDAEPVSIKSSGRLERVLVRPGQRVRAGDVLAELSNTQLDLSVEEARRQQSAYETQLVGLRRLQRFDSTVGGRIPSVTEALRSTEDQLASLRQQQDWLRVTAPVDGRVMTVDEKRPQPAGPAGLPAWSGSLLRPENLGARVELDDVLCLIGDPDKFEARLVIDQADLPFVREGMNVRIRLDAFSSDTFRGQIAEIAKNDMEAASATWSTQTGGTVSTVTDAAGNQRPLSASYEARVPLDDLPVNLRAGLRGQAKIDAEWQPLATRLWRLISRTFHFRM
jgi:putative peptide zinc metalloprotease protein